MAIFAIGDLQGCYSDLNRLLEKVQFDPSSDTIWFTGDLVNRGPESLACLRFVHSLGDSAVAVLGNHDLHLIAKSEGLAPESRSDPDLDEIIDAPDAGDLLDWLRHRPLAHFEHETLLLHAGVPPQWSAAMTMSLAKEAEQTLRSDNYRALLSVMYGDTPDVWRDSLMGFDRLRFIINALTRLRFCGADGRCFCGTKAALNRRSPTPCPGFVFPGGPARIRVLCLDTGRCSGCMRKMGPIVSIVAASGAANSVRHGLTSPGRLFVFNARPTASLAATRLDRRRAKPILCPDRGTPIT